MPAYAKTNVETIEVKKLKSADVPLVIDDWTLAFRLGFNGKTFWYIINHRDKLYSTFKRKKASGGLRVIHNPKPVMRVLAKQLRLRILLPLCKKLGKHVGAYQTGKSVRDTAKQHIFPCAICDALDTPHGCSFKMERDGAQYRIIRVGGEECPACKRIPKHTCPRRGVKIHMDLKDFFTSTRRSWIRQYFQEVVGYNHYVSSLLAQLLTVPFEDKKYGPRNGVPQGSPSSGDICNLVADWKLDQHILKELPDWTYTRYADDLYLSHPENLPKEKVNEVIKKITELVTTSGYRVNRKKLHVQRPKRRQKVLGMTINQKVSMGRDKYRKLRSLLHNCVRHGFDSQVAKAKKKDGLELQSWIGGQLSYLQLVDPDKAQRLKLIYDHALSIHGGDNKEIVFK